MLTTEAGKRLYEETPWWPDKDKDIAAIEAEAREKGIRDVIDRVESDIRAAIIQEIKTLPTFVLPTGTYVDIEDVYDILREAE